MMQIGNVNANHRFMRNASARLFAVFVSVIC